jgi:hypothetical protein
MVGSDPATALPSLVWSPVRRPHGSCAAPVNARTVSGASIGGGARLPSVVAARSATCRRVNRSGHRRTFGKSLRARTASAQRPIVAHPAAAVKPRLPKGLVRRRTSVGATRSIPYSASASAIAQAEYQRRFSIARGTTSTTASHATHRNRRQATVNASGFPAGSCGPKIHRVRKPCPCNRKLAPAGRLATSHAGHRFGRTSSGDGGFASHLLTSSSLCTIRVGLRSLSGEIYPGPRWGRCWLTGPHHYFSRQDHPAPPPPPSGPRTTSRPPRRSKRPT